MKWTPKGSLKIKTTRKVKWTPKGSLQSSGFIINKEIDDSIIFIALLIDAPNNLVIGDTINYYTAEDDETLKIKVENQNNEGFTTVYFVFDNQGDLIGYKVSFETTDKTACYSFQVKLN